ncbi:hypothetical protein [Streptomyces sp. ID38640]|uniref:hypothetical protein n=1 Tax=Streptomyces sp. ID38640 TaxID=1265399 RepID=UPI002180B54E|nr:hypothetical protein [Streptomyces sp. ID38640]
MTVAAWIRHQRLERARRDLTDPALGHHTICQIATHWGFTRAADSPAPFAPTTACHPGTTATKHSAPRMRRTAKHCALPANDFPQHPRHPVEAEEPTTHVISAVTVS